MKPSYKSLITKDDQLYLSHAKKSLRGDWPYVWAEAMDKYKEFDNAQEAKREANLVILHHLTEIGANHWREPKGEQKQDKPARIKVDRNAKPPERRAKKHWTGPSILDMADERRNK